MKRLALAALGLFLGLSSALGQTSITQYGSRLDSTNAVAVGTNFNTVNQQAVATATSQAGLYVYVTGIDIELCGDATGTAATNTNFTSTGISGTPSWSFSATTGTTAGTCQRIGDNFAIPLRSVNPGTNVVVTSPTAQTHTAFGIRIFYYLAP